MLFTVIKYLTRKVVLLVFITSMAITLFIYFLPSIYKQQIMYAFFTSPYKEHKTYLDQLLTNRIIDFTDRKDILFYCYGTKEISNSIHSKQFAKKHNLMLIGYKDILAKLNASLQRFYLVKANGSVELFAFIDNRRDFEQKFEGNTENYNILTPSKKCFFNTKPIKVYLNDG